MRARLINGGLDDPINDGCDAAQLRRRLNLSSKGGLMLVSSKDTFITDEQANDGMGLQGLNVMGKS